MMIGDQRKAILFILEKKWVRLLAFLSFDQNKICTLKYFRLIVID